MGSVISWTVMRRWPADKLGTGAGQRIIGLEQLWGSAVWG